MMAKDLSLGGGIVTILGTDDTLLMADAVLFSILFACFVRFMMLPWSAVGLREIFAVACVMQVMLGHLYSPMFRSQLRD